MLQLVGRFLLPENAQKMKETSNQWTDVKIYENIFPNDVEVAVFRDMNTEEILWETIIFTKFWKPIRNQEKLVSILRQNDAARWNDLFLWFLKNWGFLVKNFENKTHKDAFLKEIMLATTENVDFTCFFCGMSPLLFVAALDDIDSILTRIRTHFFFPQPAAFISGVCPSRLTASIFALLSSKVAHAFTLPKSAAS
jgi:hypothetical protein